MSGQRRDQWIELENRRTTHEGTAVGWNNPEAHRLPGLPYGRNRVMAGGGGKGSTEDFFKEERNNSIFVC